MRAGALKYRLTLLEPQRVTDRMGAERVDYIETRTVRAERVRTTGNRSEEVGEHFPAYSAEFNIRDGAPGPRGGDERLRQQGPRFVDESVHEGGVDRFLLGHL